MANIVEIVIRGVDKTKEGLTMSIRNVNDLATAVGKLSTAIKTAAGSFLAFGAWDIVKSAAETNEALTTLDGLTRQYGMTARGMTDQIKEASTGLIGLKTAASVANDALLKGFTPQQIAQMAQWSVTLSHASGGATSAAENFRTLEESMATARERGVVRLLGTTIDLTAAYGNHAAAMTKAEKQMAIFTLAAERMAQIQKVLGKDTDSVADKMERLNIQLEGFKKTIGDFLIRAGAGLVATFQSIAALALGLARVIMAPITALAMATDYLGITKGKAEEYQTAMEALGDAALFTAEQAADNFEIMKKGFSTASTGIGNLPPPGGKNMKNLEDTFKKLRELEEKAAEARERLMESSTKAMEEFRLKGLNPIQKEYEDLDRAFYNTLATHLEAWDAGAISMEEYNRRTSDAVETHKQLKDQLDAVNRSGIEMQKWQSQARQAGEAFRSERGIEQFRWKSQTPKARYESAYAAGDVGGAMEAFGGEGGLGPMLSQLDEAQTKINAFRDVWMTAHKSISQSAVEIGMAVRDGLVNTITDVIMGAKTAGEAFAALGKMILRMIVQTVMQWIVNRLILAAMGPTIAAAEMAAMMPIAAATAAMWAPAATMASVATFGGAAAAGAAGLTSAYATAMGIAAMTTLAGAAHGGLTNVPAERTYLLDKGERVLSPKQNEDLVTFLDGTRGGSTELHIDGDVLCRWIQRQVRTGRLQLTPV